MSDDRLDILKNAVAESSEPYGSVRIDWIKLRYYRFFSEEFSLDFKGKNVLLFGENGTGKSSIYRALELLAGEHIQSIIDDRNIFCESGTPEVEFGFTNGTELIFDPDMEDLPEAFDFVKGLSVFTPMLDYKKLLRIHYAPTQSPNPVNLYEMFRQMLKDYPVSDDQILSEIKDPSKYFDALSG